jgi:hypothetical protein
MAVVHYAWNLDLARLRVALTERGVDSNDRLYGVLQQLAVAKTRKASSCAYEYLIALRMAPGDLEAWSEVLDPPDAASRRRAIAKLCLVAMAGYLQPAPRLREPWILDYSLDELGWSRNARDFVLGGRSLASLVEELEIPALEGSTPLLTDYRGWLDCRDRRRLLEALAQVAEWFSDPPDEFVDEVAAQLFTATQQVRASIRHAHADAVAMLEYGNDREHGLRLILD